MRTTKEARQYSKQNPTELVEFKEVYSDGSTQRSGFFLNGKREGICDFYQNDPHVLDFRDIYNSKTSHAEVFCFWDDGRVASHYFTRKTIMHGEAINVRSAGSMYERYFVVNNQHMEELDYLVNEPRDEAFYFTLSLYGIDKEYIIGAV